MGFKEFMYGKADEYDNKTLARVKCVGVRTAEQTKVLATYNYGIYSFLVEFTDGSRGIYEEQLGSVGMKKLINFIEW